MLHATENFRKSPPVLTMSEDGAGEDDLAQQRALLEKIKDAANGPEHAKRRIEALDKMVHALKSRRKLCGESMVADEEKMHWIDMEMGQINKLYLPLQAQMKERIETRDRVKAQLELAEKTMRQILSQTKGTAFAGRIANARMTSKDASAKLTEQRGFSVDPSTTFHPSASRKRSTSRKK